MTTKGNANPWTYHAPGIRSKLRARDGRRVYYCVVTSNGRRFTEKAGATQRQAVRLLGQRVAEVDAGTYVPPKQRKRAARKADADRELLRFDAAAERFLADCATEYSRPAALRSYVRMLGRYFAGRYLDELTAGDVQNYMRARTAHEGPFKKLTRRTGLRPPQIEVTTLSQIVRHLQDCGYALANPCLRPRSVQILSRTRNRAILPCLPSPR